MRSSQVPKELGITMDGEQTDKLHRLRCDRLLPLRCPPLAYIWGVVDVIVDTDFPDVRNRSAIHSTSGSCMIIPREGDKVRFYIQLSDSNILDSITGWVDKNGTSPQKLLEVAKKILRPYKVHEPEMYGGRFTSLDSGWRQSFHKRMHLHCGRCMPYTFPKGWTWHECRHERYSRSRVETRSGLKGSSEHFSIENIRT